MAIVSPIGVPRTTDPKEVRKWWERVSVLLSYQTYAGDPTGNIVPRRIGDLCLDTTNSDWYKSTGVVAASWTKISA
jgi:hypothetical protein